MLRGGDTPGGRRRQGAPNLDYRPDQRPRGLRVRRARAGGSRTELSQSAPEAVDRAPHEVGARPRAVGQGPELFFLGGLGPGTDGLGRAPTPTSPVQPRRRPPPTFSPRAAGAPSPLPDEREAGKSPPGTSSHRTSSSDATSHIIIRCRPHTSDATTVLLSATAVASRLPGVSPPVREVPRHESRAVPLRAAAGCRPPYSIPG